jgi:hypothetical protein
MESPATSPPDNILRVIRFIDDLMMKGDSSLEPPLTARSTSGALAPAFASGARRFPETVLHLQPAQNTNGHPITAGRP